VPDLQDYMLGDPESDAVQVEPDVWRRRFGGSNRSNDGATNMTVVFWDNIKKTGNISWAGATPPPPPPPGALCDPTTFRQNTAYADGPGIGKVPAASALVRQLRHHFGPFLRQFQALHHPHAARCAILSTRAYQMHGCPDAAWFVQPDVVPDSCLQACCIKCAAAAAQGCLWFSFDRGTGTCFLKADDSDPHERAGVTSGSAHR